MDTKKSQNVLEKHGIVLDGHYGEKRAAILYKCLD